MSGPVFRLPVVKMSWEKIFKKKPMLLINFCFMIHFDFWNTRIFSFSIRSKVMNPKIPLCELCSKQLPSHAALEKHRKAKHSDISFACEECGKQFKTVKNLLDHQRSHKTCVCYKCGKSKCISAINYIYISFKLLAYYFDKRRLWDPDQCKPDIVHVGL